MLISKIIFKNFMGYKNLNLPKGDDEFPHGLILISGNNSYGKSTILEGILYAFFGPKIFRGKNAESFITYGESRAEVTIYFNLDNTNYYLLRKWGRSSSSTSKLFELDKKKKVYQEIRNFDLNDFFEISPEQAMSTVFVRQGEVEELANKKGAELRELIIDIFRLNIIEDALLSLEIESKDKKYKKEALEKSRVPIERINEDITRVEKEIVGLEKEITEKEKLEQENIQKINKYPSNELISELENIYTQKEIINNRFLSYKNDFEKKLKNRKLSLDDFSSSEQINTQIKKLKTIKAELESQKITFDSKREATFKGLGKTKGRIEDTNKKIDEMEKNFKLILIERGEQIAKCPTCQSDLTKEHYDNIIKRFKKEIKINQAKIKSITTIINDIDKELSEVQNNLEKINEDITIIEELRNDYDNFNRSYLDQNLIQEKLINFLKNNQAKFKDTSPSAIKNLSLKKERLYTELKAIQNEIKDKNNYIKTSHNRITELCNEIEKMNIIKSQIGELDIDIDHITKAKEYVRRFVTEYMVVKRLVKNIALKTNKYIKDFTSGQYSDLILDLAGTRKTGLSLRIRDNYNNVHEPIEALSGGDRTALGMALRLAISELMGIIRPTKDSPKKNPKINFLLLDEPIAALDETRRERILNRLTKSKTFSQIFLITHTRIPSDIQAHKILVDKDISTGISYARFEKQANVKII